MKVPFFDRTRADAAIEEDLVAAFRRVVASGRYILGPEVEAFEAACAPLVGKPYTVGVSSCTDALLVSLSALGVGPGDEVICPAYTFFATAGSIARLGARPVFADVLPGCLTLDPDAITRRITPRTKGVVAVHLFGMCADLPRIHEIARGRGLFLVEDCAQAMGSERRGLPAGAAGSFSCYSFFPTKNVGGFGDAGLIATSDLALARLARSLRVHGAGAKHHHEHLGGNFRIDALQAALLAVKLRGMGAAVERRREHAARYDELFNERGLSTSKGGALDLGERDPGHSFNQYVVRVRGFGVRDRLRAHLDARGVGTEIYYPTPLHLQPAFAGLGYAEGDLPVTESAAREALALPIFPELRADEIEHVAAEIAAFFA